MLSRHDRQLIADVRAETGARSDSQLSSEELEDELAVAKQHLSDELKQALDSGTFNFYEKESAEKALQALLCLRVHNRIGRGSGPTTLGEIRRTTYADPQAAFWRDDLVRHLNRLTDRHGV